MIRTALLVQAIWTTLRRAERAVVNPEIRKPFAGCEREISNRIRALQDGRDLGAQRTGRQTKRHNQTAEQDAHDADHTHRDLAKAMLLMSADSTIGTT